MDPSSPDAVAKRLRVVVGRLRRRMQDESSVGDLTAPQASALARLAVDEPSSTSQLAGAERVRPQSMAKTVAGLLDHGLVRRRPDPDDGRRQLLHLTDEGRAWARGASASRAEWLADELGRACSPDELAVLDRALALLERVVEASVEESLVDE